MQTRRWICLGVSVMLGWTTCVQPAVGQVSTYAEICGNPKSAPHDVVHFCRKILETGRLERMAEAQVRVILAISLFDLGRISEAINENTRALALVPDMVAASLNRARAHERAGDLTAALADYAAVLQRDPRDADAYLGRGALLLRNGDPARAVHDLGKAIALRPHASAAYFNRGLALAAMGDPSAAERDFSAVIARDARDAAAHMHRGQARAAQNLTTALADLTRAIDLAPEWAQAWYVRGRYLDGQGRREAANRDFLRANALGYRDVWLTDRIRDMSG